MKKANKARGARVFLMLAALGLLLLPARAGAQGGADGIAAVVNDQPITISAVADRMKLVMISSGMPNDPEVRAKVQPQVINILIDEALRLQEAQNSKITVDDAAIDQGMETIAQQNSMNRDQFMAVLRNAGINVKTLRDQIRAQVAWARVVEGKLSSQVEVSEFDVDMMTRNLQENIGKDEYLTAEIFLPVDSPAEENDVRKMAEGLAQQLRAGQARFSAVAGQFSQAAGASKGGDLGWVQEGQLAPELDEALRGLREGEITAPLRSLSGYHILLLRDRRPSAPDTLPSRDEIFNRIGMQNLERVQRRHFLRLKAAAFIERRGV